MNQKAEAEAKGWRTFARSELLFYKNNLRIGWDGSEPQEPDSPSATSLARQPTITDFDIQDVLEWEQSVTQYDKWLEQDKTELYDYMCGDLNGTAVYVTPKEKAIKDIGDHSRTTVIPPQDLITLLELPRLDGEKMVRHLSGFMKDSPPPQHGNTTDAKNLNSLGLSMQLLCTASKVYSLLPGATISLMILNEIFHVSPLARAGTRAINHPLLGPFQPVEWTLAETLSFIAWAETGGLLLKPRDLKQVLALSTGNSIYAAASLFADPYDVCQGYELRRIVGNVGRAGVSMLVPPINPKLQNPRADTWNVINHEAFTGKTQCLNNFENTSLHLSFTGYEQPVPGGVVNGSRDVGACYLETVISVFDRGRKVGDLDILKGIDDSMFSRLSTCTHTSNWSIDCDSMSLQWTCIDSWEEMLDMPDNRTCIVRAHKNALSRIAAAVVCVQQGERRFIVLPPKPCYACVVEKLGHGGWGEGQNTVLIC
ncbi:Uu.00g130850.m01.CDS01 [Anthostomella pinea]|uniref:Uu.00g130850.m01.CDS01 n=1 Tax=Anthostomella pinea TaxID=933095 RepID=A0AAI8VJD2_9PEZI|nr:Uu.00g130850.m01.CDS01 [Anthostomella pinea]